MLNQWRMNLSLRASCRLQSSLRKEIGSSHRSRPKNPRNLLGGSQCCSCLNTKSTTARRWMRLAFASMSPDDDAAIEAAGYRQIGRWHDTVNGRGVAIVEAESSEALHGSLMMWAGMAET